MDCCYQANEDKLPNDIKEASLQIILPCDFPECYYHKPQLFVLASILHQTQRFMWDSKRMVEYAMTYIT